MILLLKFLVMAVATLAAKAFEIDDSYRPRSTTHRHLFPRSSAHLLPDWNQADSQAASDGAPR